MSIYAHTSISTGALKMTMTMVMINISGGWSHWRLWVSDVLVLVLALALVPSTSSRTSPGTSTSTSARTSTSSRTTTSATASASDCTIARYQVLLLVTLNMDQNIFSSLFDLVLEGLGPSKNDFLLTYQFSIEQRV
jgi:hypothetical protein